MHVLIATTGALSVAPAVEFTSHLMGDEARVSVTTVIEVPRSFLRQLRAEGWHPLGAVNSEDGLETDEDAVMGRYVEERGRRLTEPIVNALRAAGIEAEAIYLEGDDPAVKISELANKIDADLVILGATRQIFDQAAWESVSARVMIESGRPVLVVPLPRKDPTAPNNEA
jgi:nucleotide-binding universal stress UspA family protein